LNSLVIKDVYLNYGAIAAVRGVSLSLKKGRITCIIGPNGAGKSTVLKGIMGLVKVKSGEIFFKEKRIDNLRTDRIVKMRIGLVPEGRGLFGKMSVEENLLMGALMEKEKDRISTKLQEMYQLFPILKERRRNRAATLSGGQQQMLSISRALMMYPEVLLMDEPSLGLAPMVVKEILSVIKVLNEDEKTILLVEQNAKQALEISHSAHILVEGKIVAEGEADELMRGDEVKKAYLSLG